MSYWGAKWYGALIGLVAGAFLAAIVIAWRYHPVLGVVVAVLVGVATFCAVRYPLLPVFGADSPFGQAASHPDFATIIIRFVCGSLVGVLFGFRIAGTVTRSDAAFFVVWSVVAAAFGVLASLLGDRFWHRS